MGLDLAWAEVLESKGLIESPQTSPAAEVRTLAPPKAKRKAATPKEVDIQRAVIEYLALCGAVTVRVNSGGMYAGERADGSKRYIAFNDTKGCSDILACLPHPRGGLGVFAAVEVKRPGEHTKPHQQSFLDWVAKCGGLSLVVHSVAELAEQLRERGFYAP